MQKDGERFTSDIIVIGKAEEGWSCPDIVEINYNNNARIGFLKRTIQQGEKNVIELILNRVGQELNISMADTVGVFLDESYSQLIAVISLHVITKPGERFICFREMRDQLFFEYQVGKLPTNEWMKRWISIRDRRRFLKSEIWEVDALNRQDYVDCIFFGLEIIKLYTKKRISISKEFMSDYITMVMFDILIGQADRSPSNYGIILDENTKSARFAPLFDNSTLSKPYIQKEMICFNQIILDRQKTSEVVFGLFNEIAVVFREILYENSNKIMNILNSRNQYYDEKTSDYLVERIKEGVRIIEAI